MKNLAKRFLAMLMAVVMVLSAAPIETFAAGNHDHATEENTEHAEETLVQQLQEKVDAILVKYLGKTDLTEDEITDIVINMPWDTMEAALEE